MMWSEMGAGRFGFPIELPNVRTNESYFFWTCWEEIKRERARLSASLGINNIQFTRPRALVVCQLQWNGPLAAFSLYSCYSFMRTGCVRHMTVRTKHLPWHGRNKSPHFTSFSLETSSDPTRSIQRRQWMGRKRKSDLKIVEISGESFNIMYSQIPRSRSTFFAKGNV